MADAIFLFVMIGLAVLAQFDWLKNWKYNWAIDAIRLGVAWTYNEFVREIKEDGSKLTPEQRAQARKMAVDKVKELAAKRGFDLSKIIGDDDLLELFVEVYVSKAKSGS